MNVIMVNYKWIEQKETAEKYGDEQVQHLAAVLRRITSINGSN